MSGNDPPLLPHPLISTCFPLTFGEAQKAGKGGFLLSDPAGHTKLAYTGLVKDEGMAKAQDLWHRSYLGQIPTGLNPSSNAKQNLKLLTALTLLLGSNAYASDIELFSKEL